MKNMEEHMWIRRTLLALFGLALLVVAPTAKAGDEMPAWLKVGTRMTYGVEFSGQNYDFIVTVKQLGPDLVFDYEMTAPANKKGNVTIRAKALVDADKMNNMFGGGPMVLEDKTTVWIAQTFVKEYRAKELSHRIDTGSGYEIFLPPDAPDKTYKATVDGKEVTFPIHHITADGGSQTLWFHDNLAAPLIFKMDLGWKIWLKTIETPKAEEIPTRSE
jgi:hypothetical protein